MTRLVIGPLGFVMFRIKKKDEEEPREVKRSLAMNRETEAKSMENRKGKKEEKRVKRRAEI